MRPQRSHGVPGPRHTPYLEYVSGPRGNCQGRRATKAGPWRFSGRERTPPTYLSFRSPPSNATDSATSCMTATDDTHPIGSTLQQKKNT